MPLHLAAMYPECRSAVLYHVLAAYPEGAKSKDYRWVDYDTPGEINSSMFFVSNPNDNPQIGSWKPSLRRKQLPLHRACKARASLKKCLPLIESYPEALSIRDWGGNKVGLPACFAPGLSSSHGPLCV